MINGFGQQRIVGTSAGTTQVYVGPVTLHNIYVGANKTGTASFYDCGTVSGTTSNNFLFDLANTVGSIPTSINFDVAVSKGITVVVGGTVDFNVIYG